MGTTENIETSCTMLIQGMWYSGLTLCCVWASANQHLDFSKRLIIALHETKTGSHGSIHNKSKPPLRAKNKTCRVATSLSSSTCREQALAAGVGAAAAKKHSDDACLRCNISVCVLQSSRYVPTAVIARRSHVALCLLHVETHTHIHIQRLRTRPCRLQSQHSSLLGTATARKEGICPRARCHRLTEGETQQRIN